MKVFVAGAGGAIGKHLIPALVRAGHSVTGMTRSAGKTAAIRAAGAEAIIADALDRDAVLNAVRAVQPDAIVHELTAIPAALDVRKFKEQFKTTNRLRTEGTDHLLAAAHAAGVRRVVAQSYAGWPYARTGGPVKSEEDPLDPDPPAAMRDILRAIKYLESAVLSASGIEGLVLRYAGFYGPGNAIGEGGVVVNEVRRRRFPIIGGGAGIWSFLHIEDAAGATLAAVEGGAPGIYNIADDDPAPVCDWLPALAHSVGARPPLPIPAWLGRLMIGEHGVVMMTDARGASNQKAKRELGWRPVWPTWRDGFRNGLSETAPANRTLERQGLAS